MRLVDDEEAGSVLMDRKNGSCSETLANELEVLAG